MAELKPCPFCGDDKIKVMMRNPWHGENITYYVICYHCGSRTALHDENQRAIEAWNRRAEDGKA